MSADLANAPPAGERVLVIKAKSGLGNRILAAVTGIILARLTERRPVIDWRDGIYLPDGVNLYPLLFDAPGAVEPEAFDRETDVEPRIWSGCLSEQPLDLVRRHFPKSHASPFVYRRLSLDLASPEAAARVAVFWSYLPKFERLRAPLRRHRRLRRYSLDELIRDALHEHFHPNARIRDALDRLFAGRARPVIGVHVRYTDRKAPLERIERALAQMRRRLPDAEIFLATDSAEVQRRIAGAVPNVFMIDKELPETGTSLHLDGGLADPLREAENAVIDLLALARCDRLIHSRHSTFSVAAATIGMIPRSCQIDVDRLTPAVVLKRWVQAYA